MTKWSEISDYTAMPDHSPWYRGSDPRPVPDYDLDDVLELTEPQQFKALFEETRLHIIDMLSERAATTSQLGDALDRPKGTIGHHLGVLEDAGLVRVVRTEKVRAIEAKYYGRTARTFLLDHVMDEPRAMFATAPAELRQAKELFGDDPEVAGLSTVRYARIPNERAGEWQSRLTALVEEFVGQPRGGDLVYGLAVALYPTARPHLPEGQD